MDRAQYPRHSKGANLNDSQTRVVQQHANSPGRSFQNQTVPTSSRGNDELGQVPQAYDQDVAESTAAALEAWHLEESIPSVHRPSNSIYQGGVKSEQDWEVEQDSPAPNVVESSQDVEAGVLAQSKRKTKQSLKCTGCKKEFGRLSALKQHLLIHTRERRE
ncbi:hypothetical protein FRC00_000179 [Tulasnella sp. 408]|nr:hypothetical protein FRC00_000179 [Tulasnella sp. 408]